MKNFDVRGTILLAREGINGTIAGTREGVDQVRAELKKIPGLPTLEYKENTSDSMPFKRTKVKLKKEIITFGEAIDFAHAQGTHVPPNAWNELIADPSVLVLDSRNKYEVELGSFARAVDPDIRTFTQLKKYVAEHLDPATHPKIATFCTGGIRCEKFAAYLKQKGFKDVYQLQGGILKYLQDVPKEKSLWEGECFVFDERTSISSPCKGED